MDDEAENKREPRQYTPLQPFPHHFRNKEKEQSLEPEPPTLRHNYYHSRRKVLHGIMANLKWFFLLIVSGLTIGMPRFLMKGWSVTSLEIEGPNQEQYRAIFPRYNNDGKLLDPDATIKIVFAPPPPPCPSPPAPRRRAPAAHPPHILHNPFFLCHILII